MKDETSDLAIHPVADLFPLLPAEELADLTADIREHGLLHPIVLDQEGRVLDGRNRLRACRLAGVQPAFVTYEGDDPSGYALSVNIARRHLSKGQRAMIAAKACFETKQTMRDSAKGASVSATRVAYASVVLEYAPELVAAVIAGASLDEAYAVAQQRKAMRDAKSQEETRQLRTLRERFPHYAALVGEGTLSLSQAMAAIRVEETEQRATEELEKAEHSLRLAVEEIGPAIPLPPMPNLSISADMTEVQQNLSGSTRLNTLERHQVMLQRLIRVVNELKAIAALKQDVDLPLPGAILGGVRSGVSQIVAGAYHIADEFNAAESADRLRRVK